MRKTFLLDRKNTALLIICTNSRLNRQRDADGRERRRFRTLHILFSSTLLRWTFKDRTAAIHIGPDRQSRGFQPVFCISNYSTDATVTTPTTHINTSTSRQHFRLNHISPRTRSARLLSEDRPGPIKHRRLHRWTMRLSRPFPWVWNSAQHKTVFTPHYTSRILTIYFQTYLQKKQGIYWGKNTQN